MLLLASQAGAQQIKLDSVGMTGTKVYRSGYWSLLEASLTNPTATDASPLLAVSLNELTNVQFAIRPWVPAQAQRRVTLPIYMAVDVPDGKRSWSAQAVLIDESQHQERVLRRSLLELPIYQNRISTVAIIDQDTPFANKVIRALRAENKSLSPATSRVTPRRAPDKVDAWHGVDTALVAHEDADQLNVAQYDAMRQWLLGGGRLWIMLDRTPERFAKQLLGDAWDVVALDRLELTTLQIKRPERSSRRRAQSQSRHETIAFDYPVDMVRVIAPTWNITHTVRGYPAAMWRSVGQGRVIVSTLDARAWVKPDGEATESLVALHDWLQAKKQLQVQQQTHDAFSSFVSQQIGYHILSLWPVSMVLGAYLLAILLVGGVLAKRDRLEWLAPVGMGLAVVGAAVLTLLGLMQQTQRPTTLAVAQFAVYDADQPYVDLTSRVSVYRSPTRDAQTLQLAGERNVWANMAAQGGQIMRWVAGPDDHWQMEQLNLPSGAVMSAHAAQIKPLASPTAAVIGWDEQGRLIGRIEGDGPKSLDDAVIASRDGRLAVRFEPDGTFTASPSDALDAGQFMQATMLSQTQQARLPVYRTMFENRNRIQQPSLMGWADALPVGLSLGKGVTRRSDALMMMSLQYEKPAAGQRVSLPYALLNMSILRNVPGVTSSTVFDPKTRQFISPISTEDDMVYRLDLPQAMLPMRLETVTMEMDITALGREVSLVVYRDGQLKTIETFSSPSQPQVRTVEGDNLPTLTSDGWVGVGLRVGAIAPGQGTGWTLRKFEAHLKGTTQTGDSHE